MVYDNNPELLFQECQKANEERGDCTDDGEGNDGVDMSFLGDLKDVVYSPGPKSHHGSIGLPRYVSRRMPLPNAECHFLQLPSVHCYM